MLHCHIPNITLLAILRVGIAIIDFIVFKKLGGIVWFRQLNATEIMLEDPLVQVVFVSKRALTGEWVKHCRRRLIYLAVFLSGFGIALVSSKPQAIAWPCSGNIPFEL